LQTISVLSDVLGPVRMRLSAAAIRTIQVQGQHRRLVRHAGGRCRLRSGA
jgi:ribosomal protein L28